MTRVRSRSPRSKTTQRAQYLRVYMVPGCRGGEGDLRPARRRAGLGRRRTDAGSGATLQQMRTVLGEYRSAIEALEKATRTPRRAETDQRKIVRISDSLYRSSSMTRRGSAAAHTHPDRQRAPNGAGNAGRLADHPADHPAAAPPLADVERTLPRPQRHGFSAATSWACCSAASTG